MVWAEVPSNVQVVLDSSVVNLVKNLVIVVN